MAALSPPPIFKAYALIVLILVVGTVALYAGAIIKTWRKSAIRSSAKPWWTRWYSLLGTVIVINVILQVMVSILHQYYKPFYAAAESMAPALDKNDRFLADMARTQKVSRGTILLFQTSDGIRIYRVVGLPGDRVAMKDGIPIINGQPASRRFSKQLSYMGIEGQVRANAFIEQLPGEHGHHLIIDLGEYPTDEMIEVLVPSRRLFVLGDNRDRAADSRVPFEVNGIGMPSFYDLRGRPLFFYWSRDRSKIGTDVH